MSGKSTIEWTEMTWNPVTGCSKVSPGCAHCYAETISLRFGHSVTPWTPENATENVVLHPERLDQPLRWRKPRMVFVNSMSDLFHEQIPDSFVFEVFGVMSRAPQHTFQILTKRPERMLETSLLLSAIGNGWPLPNVWLGVSIENARYTWRADVLRKIPAAVRFVSAEPLLGSLYAFHGSGNKRQRPLDLAGIDWLIVGGESGSRHARPMQPEWARELRDACLAETETAFFFKQWGSHDEHGTYRGASPKSGGRLLDGREWNEMPT